jgi:hypothetical protein
VRLIDHEARNRQPTQQIDERLRGEPFRREVQQAQAALPSRIQRPAPRLDRQ